MQKNSTVTQATTVSKLVDTVSKEQVAIVVTVIITAITAAKCSILLYDDVNAVCKHDMKFQLQQNETIFIQSKLFLTQGNSLRVKSDAADTTFTAMYDVSVNS